MQQTKKYVPKSNAKTRQAPWGPVLCLGFNAAALIEFVQQNTNSKGFINFEVVQRKNPQEGGDTHSIVLNDYQPKASQAKQADDDSPPF